MKGIGAVVSSLDKSGRLSGSRVGIVELVELTRGKEIVVVYGVVCLIKFPDAMYENA